MKYDMAPVHNFSRARQNLAALLEKAATEGEVRTRRKDGRVFVIKPEPRNDSPFDIEGIKLGLSTDEIVEIIRTGRKARSRV